jgi:NAD(P)-dependent dehydrogenase (short-subunit alcohol dehydrogenase family)
MDFENKKIIVAGASGGIGGATCEALAAEGAVVIMIGRSEEKLRNQMEKLNGTGHRCYLCDLGIVDSIEPCISQIIEECGAVDGFVHSAGVGDVRPLKMSKYDFMLRVMNINFFSYVEIVRCITKRGAYKEGLSIVGISSVGAQYGRQSRTAYSASKGAMDASMRTMAKELGVKGIRVNNIAPGGTRSSMTDDFDAYANLSDENRLIALRQYLGECEPSDVANAVLFLLSEKSRKITGTILNVDGGKMSC